MREDKKNIIFICGSLQQGKDGVGDYTYKLATEIFAMGFIVSILAINDKYLAPYQKESNIQNGISTLRISSKFNKNKRRHLIKTHVKEQNPSYISLQFVPFAFHKRGISISLIKLLADIANSNWNIMFHELWVGMERTDSLKLKLWGMLQRYIAVKLIKKLKPRIIHSSNPLYIYHLKHIYTNSLVKELPLFSNITKSHTPEVSQTTKKIKIVLFAGIHFGAPVNCFIKWLIKEIETQKKVLEFIFIGNNGPHMKEWLSVLDIQNISYHVLGFQNDNEISRALASANIGVSTTPYYLSGKSGSTAAMLEHQLPVLCVSRRWIPKVSIDPSLLAPRNIIEWRPTIELNEIIDHKFEYSDLNNVAKRFILDLEWHH